VESSRQDLYHLLEASYTLFTSLDIKEVVGLAYDLAARHLGANLVVVGLKESGERVKVLKAPGQPGSDEVVITTLEHRPLTRVRVPYQAVLVSHGALQDLARELEVEEFHPKEGWLCPLEIEGHAMGFVLITHPADAPAWTESDVERVITLLKPLAQALENARFHRQLAQFSDESLAIAYEKLKAAYEELQRMQDQLLSTEKLQAVGRLASSVAHQLRNPLGVIQASAQLLLTKCQPEGVMKERLEAIHRSAVHADAIITELLQVARPQPIGPLARVALRPVMDAAVKMVEPKLLDAGIALRRMYGELPAVMGSAHHLQQVFMNFLMNALEAMPDKGTITITGRVEDRRVILIFQDTGQGFSPEALAHLAQPFFTTKPHGVGLGMYTAQKILEAHQGTMDVKSAPGTGTTITVTLPLAPDESVVS